MTKVFPAVMIVLTAGAAIVCGSAGDWRMAIYWGAACALNCAVTF